mgnify:CR=1 FL=1
MDERVADALEMILQRLEKLEGKVMAKKSNLQNQRKSYGLPR